nr:hypothetical protein [Paracoccus saliphilus]
MSGSTDIAGRAVQYQGGRRGLRAHGCAIGQIPARTGVQVLRLGSGGGPRQAQTGRRMAAAGTVAPAPAPMGGTGGRRAGVAIQAGHVAAHVKQMWLRGLPVKGA